MSPRVLAAAFLVAGATPVADSRAMAFLPDFVRDRPAAAVAEDRRAYSSLFADKVVVKKAERRLYLIKADEAVMSYPVSLGFSPEGHKQRLGDGRTPEGRYLLDWRNSSSKFHRSLHISYPNFSDRLRASRKGVDPGGMIMIHGQPRPNRYADLQPLVAREDWTEGCIAVPNYAIEEIWEQTMDGTPIEILP